MGILSQSDYTGVVHTGVVGTLSQSDYTGVTRTGVVGTLHTQGLHAQGLRTQGWWGHLANQITQGLCAQGLRTQGLRARVVHCDWLLSLANQSFQI